MADKIRITPSELKDQALRLQAIGSQTDDVVKEVRKAVNLLDNALSTKFSFGMKTKGGLLVSQLITLREKMILGAKTANQCAESYENADTVLRKLMENSLSDNIKNVAISQQVVGVKDTPVHKGFSSNFKGEIEDAGDALKWLETYYGKIPREIRGIINIALPDSLEHAYTITSGLLQGDLTGKNIYDVGKYICSASPHLSAVVETINYTFDTGVERTEEMEAEMKEQLMEGDILGVAIDGIEGYVDTIIGGTVECVFDMAGTVADTFIGEIPVVGGIIDEGVKYITGLATGGEEYSFGELVGAGGEAVSAFIDGTTDVLTDITDVVTSGITTGVKGVGSWIGSWFD